MSSAGRSRGLQRWLGWLLLAVIALVLLSLLLASFLLGTQLGTRWTLQVARPYLPTELSFGEVQGVLASPLEVRDLRYQADSVVLQVDRVALDWQLFDLLNGQLTVQQLTIAGSEVTLLPQEPAAQPESEAAPPSLPQLPVDIAVAQLLIQDAQVRTAPSAEPLQLQKLQGSLAWTAEQLSVSAIELSSDVADLDGSIQLAFPTGVTALALRDDGARLAASNLQIALAFALRPGTLAPVQGRLDISEQLSALKLSLTTQAPYQTLIRGTLWELLNRWRLDVRLQTQGARLTQIESGLPPLQVSANLEIAGDAAALTIAGAAEAAPADVNSGLRAYQAALDLVVSPERLRIVQAEVSERLDALEQDDQQPLQISASGLVDMAGPAARFDLAAQWQQLRWPLVGVTQVRSEQGSATLSGPLREYTARVEASLAVPNQTDGSVRLTGTGSDVQFATQSLEVATLGGKIDGEVTAHWAKGLQLQAELNAQSIDPAGLLPDWPGTLDARARIDLAALADGNLSKVDAELAIAGDLLQTPLNVDVALGYANTLLDIRRGRLSWGTDNAAAVPVAGFNLQQAILNLAGSNADHTLDVQLRSEQGALHVNLSGRADDLTALQNGNADYRFALQTLRLAPTEQPVWQLVEGGTGTFSGTAASLVNTCLSSEASRICSTANWQQEGDLALDVQLQAFAFRYLQPLLPPDLQLTGTLSGGGNARLAGERVSAELGFVTSATTLTSTASQPEATLASFAPGRLSLNANTDQTLDVHVDLPLTGSGGIEGQAQIRLDTESPGDSALTGTLSAQIPDVAFLGEFVPEVADLKGSLRSELTLAGELGLPQVDGFVQFENGSLRLLGPEITLADIDFTMRGDHNSIDGAAPLQVLGQFSTGGGQGQLQGTAQVRERGLAANLVLKGERLQLLNTVEAVVYASPDLTVQLIDKALTVRGAVAIPEANISLQNLPASAVTVSDDQVIVAADGSAENDPRYHIDTQVDLTLGDAVQFSGFGLDARFAGELRVQQQSNSAALGSGEIRIVDGRYRAYGQDLKIETGRALWSDSPLAEPGIDLRAVRKPRPDIVVGVQARGRLSRPEFSLFSEPSMSESDRLSYLVLGRPLEDNSDSESALLAQAALALGIRGGNFISDRLGDSLALDQFGIETEAGAGNSSAAFVVGKYLSPKLYVSYGLGLLDSVSTLKLEYLLSSKWRLVTESSTVDSGGDLIYTIERD